MVKKNYLLNNKNVTPRIPNRFCQIDPTHKTYVRKNGSEKWYEYKDGFICKSCWDRLFWTPKRSKEQDKLNHARRITYGKRRIFLSWNIRKGFCSWCPNNIHDDTCYETHTHHLIYIPIFVWFGTVELCPTCHTIETRKSVSKQV